VGKINVKLSAVTLPNEAGFEVIDIRTRVGIDLDNLFVADNVTARKKVVPVGSIRGTRVRCLSGITS
jgi:hypothetical protein